MLKKILSTDYLNLFQSGQVTWEDKIKNEFFISIDKDVNAKKTHQALTSTLAAEKVFIEKFLKAYFLYCVKANLKLPFMDTPQIDPSDSLANWDQNRKVETLIALEDRLLLNQNKQKLLDDFITAVVLHGSQSSAVTSICFANKAYEAIHTAEEQTLIFKLADMHVEKYLNQVRTLLPSLLSEDRSVSHKKLGEGEKFLVAIILNLLLKFDAHLSLRILMNTAPYINNELNLSGFLVYAAANFSSNSVKTLLETNIPFDEYGSVPTIPHLGPYQRWIWVACPLATTVINLINLNGLEESQRVYKGVDVNFQKQCYESAKKVIESLLAKGANPDNEFIGTDDDVDGIKALLQSQAWPKSARLICQEALPQVKDPELKAIFNLILSAPEKAPASKLPYRF